MWPIIRAMRSPRFGLGLSGRSRPRNCRREIGSVTMAPGHLVEGDVLGVQVGALAITTQRMRCGYRSVQLSACMPPRLPPITAASVLDAQGDPAAALRVPSPRPVTTGKSAP